MDTSDETLVDLACGGDGDAFAALLSRHYDRIFRLAFRVLGSRSEAEDLAQDICVGLAAKLRGYRGEARFTTWLYRVTVNAARDRLRRRKARRGATDGWADLELLSREADAEARAERRWLHQALATLPPDLSETVALILGEDLTHRQAAEVLDISEGTVSWRMSEVRKHLRRLAETEERYP